MCTAPPAFIATTDRNGQDYVTPNSSEEINSPLTNNFSNALSDGAVIGSVAIVITIIVTVPVILLILFMLYRKKKLNSPKNDRTIAINNNMYYSTGKV